MKLMENASPGHAHTHSHMTQTDGQVKNTMPLATHKMGSGGIKKPKLTEFCLTRLLFWSYFLRPGCCLSAGLMFFLLPIQQ